MNDISYAEDARLIAAIQNQDHEQEAFEALYRKYYKLVLFIANKECANESDAQDILQETFIEIKKSIPKLRKPQYFRLWLYRVVNSKCKDLFRNRKMTLMDSDHEMIRNYVKEERREASGDAQMKYHCDQDVILGMIDELPHGQRIVLMMYYLEQCSIKEIAQLLEIPQGTVKSRMSTGKAALKSKIAQYEQREQIKLSFHSLDALLASVFVKAIQTWASLPNCIFLYKRIGCKGLRPFLVLRCFHLECLLMAWIGKRLLLLIMLRRRRMCKIQGLHPRRHIFICWQGLAAKMRFCAWIYRN